MMVCSCMGGIMRADETGWLAGTPNGSGSPGRTIAGERMMAYRE